MKRSLLALAALTAFAGVASAQSSVTLFGIVDAGVARLSAGGNSKFGMTGSGYNSSRLGFRGVEDLGGGMQAGFWLEGLLTNDDGNVAGVNFQRRSTVSLMGNFGEIRLGRDYTPTFWNTTIYDPFGTNGVGQSLTPAMLANSAHVGAAIVAASNSVAAVRSNNSISYFLPPLGGAHLQVMYAFAENVSGSRRVNNYIGARGGFAAGPVSVHVAGGKTTGAATNGDNDVKYLNFGGSFDAGVIKVSLIVAQEKNGADAKVQAIQPGISVPIGAGMIKAAYSRYDLKKSNNDFNKIAVGYHYNLSKRSTIYTTVARVSNKGVSAANVQNNGLTSPGAAAGGNASGVEFGLRHAF